MMQFQNPFMDRSGPVLRFPQPPIRLGAPGLGNPIDPRKRKLPVQQFNPFQGFMPLMNFGRRVQRY